MRPTVVVVGGPKELVDAARSAAVVAAAARVAIAELSNAATVIATARPFAIVISADIYSFVSAEFDALARDVNATLLKVETSGLNPSQLERVLMPKLAKAHRRHMPTKKK